VNLFRTSLKKSWRQTIEQIKLISARGSKTLDALLNSITTQVNDYLATNPGYEVFGSVQIGATGGFGPFAVQTLVRTVEDEAPGVPTEVEDPRRNSDRRSVRQQIYGYAMLYLRDYDEKFDASEGSPAYQSHQIAFKLAEKVSKERLDEIIDSDDLDTDWVHDLVRGVVDILDRRGSF